jgi:hypothetical protein
MELKMDDATRNALENPQKQEVVLGGDVDKTEGGMTEEAYKAKMGAVKESIEKIPEEKIPPEKKGLFDKLKETFAKLTAKSPEQKIATLKAQLAEDIKELTHIKTVDTGLGGGLGNFTSTGFWGGLSKSYEIPQEKIDGVVMAIKAFDSMPQGPDKVEFLKNLNAKKFEVMDLMRKTADKIIAETK